MLTKSLNNDWLTLADIVWPIHLKIFEEKIDFMWCHHVWTKSENMFAVTVPQHLTDSLLSKLILYDVGTS